MFLNSTVTVCAIFYAACSVWHCCWCHSLSRTLSNILQGRHFRAFLRSRALDGTSNFTCTSHPLFRGGQVFKWQPCSMLARWAGKYWLTSRYWSIITYHHRVSFPRALVIVYQHAMIEWTGRLFLLLPALLQCARCSGHSPVFSDQNWGSLSLEFGGHVWCKETQVGMLTTHRDLLHLLYSLSTNLHFSLLLGRGSIPKT